MKNTGNRWKSRATRSIGALLVALSFVASPARAAENEDYLGTWSGLLIEEEGNLRSTQLIELILTEDRDGVLRATWGDRDPAASIDLGPVEHQNGAIAISFGGGLLKILARHARGGDELAADLTIRGEPSSVALHQDSELSARYRVPRLDSASKRQLDFKYEPPIERPGDGWEVGSILDTDIDLEPLVTFVERILAEDGYHLVDSVLIAKDGTLVFEEYFYGFNAEEPHAFASATKSLSSMVVGAAVDDGALETDQSVAGIFADLADTRWVGEGYDITLHHVLSMTAGLDWDEESVPYTDPSNPAGAMLGSPDWTRFVLDRAQAQPAGEKYVYCSGLSELLSGIVTRATGRPFEEYAAQRILEPLGIHNCRWQHRPDGGVQSSGRFRMPPRDMLKLGQVMLDGGVWNGRRILSEEWVERSLSKQTPVGEYAYGYQWHLLPKDGGGAIPVPIDSFLAAGQGGQFVLGVPEHHVVVVMTAGNFYGSYPNPGKGFVEFIYPAIVGVSSSDE